LSTIQTEDIAVFPWWWLHERATIQWCWCPTRKETSYSDRRFRVSCILFIIVIGGILVLYIYIYIWITMTYQHLCTTLQHISCLILIIVPSILYSLLSIPTNAQNIY